MKPENNLIIKGGSLLYPESLIVQDASLLYLKGTLFSPVKYSVSIYLDHVKSVEASEKVRQIIIKTNNLSITCNNFSQKKLRRLINLIENKYA